MTGAEVLIFISLLVSIPAVSSAVYESIVGTDCLDDSSDDLSHYQSQQPRNINTVIYKKERHPWITRKSEKRSFSLDDIENI